MFEDETAPRRAVGSAVSGDYQTGFCNKIKLKKYNNQSFKLDINSTMFDAFVSILNILHKKIIVN